MNIANKLTILRIILAFFCIGFILADTYNYLLIAFIIFILASITDFFDGFLARKQNIITDLGKILDPIADKILIIGVFLAFIELNVINVWVVSVIMLREFVVTSVRFYGLSKGVVLEAQMLGKHKTVSQIAGIVIIFLVLLARKVFPASLTVGFFYSRFIPWMMWYIMAITLFSGFNFFWSNRKTIVTF